MFDRDELIGLTAVVVAGTVLFMWGYAVVKTIWIGM